MGVRLTVPVNHRAKLGRAAMKALRARDFEQEIRADLEEMLLASRDPDHPRHRTAELQVRVFVALYGEMPRPADAPRLAREKFTRKAHYIVSQYGEHCVECHRELGSSPPVIEHGVVYCPACRPVQGGRWRLNRYREFTCPGCGRAGWIEEATRAEHPHCCIYCRSLQPEGSSPGLGTGPDS